MLVSPLPAPDKKRGWHGVRHPHHRSLTVQCQGLIARDPDLLVLLHYFLAPKAPATEPLLKLASNSPTTEPGLGTTPSTSATDPWKVAVYVPAAPPPLAVACCV